VTHLSALVLEEALDCVLTRVRWYVLRGHDAAIPKATRRAFNCLCDALGKPHENPWKRLPE
jgi:hypothetical protein